MIKSASSKSFSVNAGNDYYSGSDATSLEAGESKTFNIEFAI